MKTAIATFASIALLLGGCQKPSAVKLQQQPGEPGHLAKTAIKPESPDADGALESALQWSAKYAEAAEEIVRLQQKNRSLEEEKRALQGRAEELQGELNGCQKELQAANDMLLVMRKELTEWKNNVLGFRQEMLAAQQAQLEAVRKIMRLLGGDIVISEAAAVPSSQPASSN